VNALLALLIAERYRQLAAAWELQRVALQSHAWLRQESGK